MGCGIFEDSKGLSTICESTTGDCCCCGRDLVDRSALSQFAFQRQGHLISISHTP